MSSPCSNTAKRCLACSLKYWGEGYISKHSNTYAPDRKRQSNTIIVYSVSTYSRVATIKKDNRGYFYLKEKLGVIDKRNYRIGKVLNSVKFRSVKNDELGVRLRDSSFLSGQGRD